MEAPELFAGADLILPISASHIAGIIGMSHRHPAGFLFFFKNFRKHACNPSTQETDAEGLQVLGQSELHIKSILNKNKNKKG
jgi:hypothetical protein